MNKKWESYLAKIQGYFWDRVFSGYEFISGIRNILTACGSDIDNKAMCPAYHEMPMCNTPEHTVQITRVCIPKSECLEDVIALENFELSDAKTIKQTSDIRTLAFRKYYVGNIEAIQDSVTDPDFVWVYGINMTCTDEYVTIVLHDGCTLMEDITYAEDGTIIPCYVLYTVDNHHVVDHNANAGSIMGVNLCGVSNTGVATLWDLYHRGPHISTINKIVSLSVGSDICTEDGYVLDIWEESGKYCIQSSTNKVYTGSGEPIVEKGDRIQSGELLFSAVHRYDSSNVPEPDEVPVMVLNNAGTTLTAVNQDLAVVTNSKGVLIPDMRSEVWKSLNFPANMLPAGTTTQNPLQYVFNNMYPGKITQYVISHGGTIDSKLLDAANTIVCGGGALGGLSTVMVNHKESPVRLAISSDTTGYISQPGVEDRSLHMASGPVAVYRI